MYPDDNYPRRASPLNRAIAHLATFVGVGAAFVVGPTVFNASEPYVGPLLVSLYGEGWGRIMKWAYAGFCLIGALLVIRASLIALGLAIAYLGVVYGPRVAPLL